jgi:hypothetical protein
MTAAVPAAETLLSRSISKIYKINRLKGFDYEQRGTYGKT